MKKILFLSAIAAIVCSCSNDDTQDLAGSGKAVYREFTATIDDLTRLDLNDTKTAATWSVGDAIALCDGTKKETVTVTAIDETTGVATLAGNITIEPTAAYYPVWAYDADGTLNIPAEQPYSGSMPLCMKGTIENTAISFSAADNGATVVRYQAKGDITVTKAVFHAAQNQKTVARNERFQYTYTLTFDTPLTLNAETASYLDFVIPTTKQYHYYTLEIETSSVPEGALVNSYSLVRRSVNDMSVNVKSGAIIAFPELQFTKDAIAANRPIWQFGSKYAGITEKNGLQLINDWGQCTAKDNSLGLGENKLCTLGTQKEEYVTITNAEKQGGVKTEPAGTHTFRLNIGHGINKDNRKFTANIGNYRFFAVKWSAPAELAKADKVNPKASIKLDSSLGGFRGGEAHTGAIECNEPNVVIWYYDMTDELKIDKTSYYLSTNTDMNFNFIAFKCSDWTLNDSELQTDADGNYLAPEYDLYWAGFFNSVKEIEAYNNQVR